VRKLIYESCLGTYPYNLEITFLYSKNLRFLNIKKWPLRFLGLILALVVVIHDLQPE